MGDFPTLAEMGVKSFNEISDFFVRNTAPRSDSLTICYKRKKTSLLPVRRSYEFGRSNRSVVVDSGRSEMEEVYDPSPIMQEAIKELKALLAQNSSEAGPKAELLAKMETLQAVVGDGADRSEIEQRLKELKKLTDLL